MTDESALLRAVLADPADDLPRLMYADWLEEHGQEERAEFIRVQCELPKLEAFAANLALSNGASLPDDKAEQLIALRRRERGLWAKGVRGAFVGVPEGWIVAITGETPGGRDRLAEFRRGFVESVRLPLAAFAGGPCGRCTKVGDNYLTVVYESAGPDSRWVACPDCSGTGRTPGVAKALFASQPVERVTLTDREPHWNGGGYCWYRSGRRRPSAAVPGSAVLPDEFLKVRLATFVSIGDATDWLSRRAVEWGREQAAAVT